MDVVAKAEEVVKGLPKDRNGKIEVTTSQIRKFLSAVNSLSNRIALYEIQHAKTDKLTPELAGEVKYLKIKLFYQAGREPKVKTFVEKAELGKCIDEIGNSTVKFNEFAKYVEALIAFHRYYGGRE